MKSATYTTNNMVRTATTTMTKPQTPRPRTPNRETFFFGIMAGMSLTLLIGAWLVNDLTLGITAIIMIVLMTWRGLRR